MIPTRRPDRRSLRTKAIDAIAAVLTCVMLVQGGRLIAPVRAAATQVTATSSASSPFVSSPGKKVWYRIPAVVADGKGRLYAFAERRDNADPARKDMGDFDIVMALSTDKGRSWTKPRVIANDGKNRVSNPVPVIDPLTGDLLLITSIKYPNDTYKGAFIQRSSDGGRTFTRLADGYIGRAALAYGGLTGPGHALVLRNGKYRGRIVVALGARSGSTYGGYGILSDDGGKTWRKGYEYWDRSQATQPIEGTIAELSDGSLHIQYRDKQFSDKTAKPVGRTRFYAVSTDGGETCTRFKWSAVRMHSCFGSLLRPSGSSSSPVLLSGPSMLDPSGPYRRQNLGIWVSRDGGKTWGKPKVLVQSGPASYSDLVQIDKSTVGVLYESGWNGYWERISFKRVSLSSLR